MADAKAFRRRNDLTAAVVRAIKPAENGITYDIFKWVTDAATFANAGKYFKENMPQEGRLALTGQLKLSEKDMKSYMMHVSVALLCNHFCNSAYYLVTSANQAIG